MNSILRIRRTFAVALVFVLTATGLWAAGAEEEPAAAAEKEMVLDPTTGKMVTAPEYGGTLTGVLKPDLQWSFDSFTWGYSAYTRRWRCREAGHFGLGNAKGRVSFSGRVRDAHTRD